MKEVSALEGLRHYCFKTSPLTHVCNDKVHHGCHVFSEGVPAVGAVQVPVDFVPDQGAVWVMGALPDHLHRGRRLVGDVRDARL